MANNIVQAEANNVLNASVAGATYTAPTTPIKLALVSVIGTNTTAGTEVTGGSYARLSTASCWAAAASGSIATNTALTFTNMPAVTTVGIELWDSTGTPVRKWWGALTTNKTTGAGDTLTFPASSITASLA